MDLVRASRDCDSRWKKQDDDDISNLHACGDGIKFLGVGDIKEEKYGDH